jgi:hypothetical protein
MKLSKAVKAQSRLRLGITGPAGSGKTWTALEVARGLKPGARIAVLDTEMGSASKYADAFDFDVVEVAHYKPQVVLDFLGLCEREGYDVAIIDSMSPFWNGPGGFLEMVDDETAKLKGRTGKADSFAAWKPVDAVYARWVLAILASKVHVIFTIRSKMAYESTRVDGRTSIAKLGMAPICRDTFPYELDVVLDMDADHVGVVSKTRAHGLDDQAHRRPGADFAARLVAWLSSGPPPQPPQTVHDPSWEADKGRFFAALTGLNLDYEALCTELAAMAPPRPRPSAMTQEARGKLVAWLRARAAKAEAEATEAGPAEAR